MQNVLFHKMCCFTGCAVSQNEIPRLRLGMTSH